MHLTRPYGKAAPGDTYDCPTTGVLVAVQAQGGCEGCALDTNSRACCEAPNCGGIVFVKKAAIDLSAKANAIVAEDAAEEAQRQAATLAAGRKDDSGKLDITLFFDDLPNAIEGVTEVLQWAVTKKQPVPYERGSWQGVDNFQPRYRAAQLRHMLNAAKAKISTGASQHLARDHETGLLELAHIATDAMFQLEMAMREVKRLRAEAELETH